MMNSDTGPPAEDNNPFCGSYNFTTPAYGYALMCGFTIHWPPMGNIRQRVGWRYGSQASRNTASSVQP